MVITLYGPVDEAVMERAANIKLLICDVDGVFSDGRIYLGNDGEELKAFHTRDGFGVKAVQNAGLDVAVITGRKSDIVQRRMTALGVRHIFQGCDDKIRAFQHLLDATGVTADECAYIGDDLVDLPVMLRVGLSVAVQDAHPALLPQVHYQSYIPGGRGAVREICDLLLQAQGKLDQAKGLAI